MAILKCFEKCYGNTQQTGSQLTKKTTKKTHQNPFCFIVFKPAKFTSSVKCLLPRVRTAIHPADLCLQAFWNKCSYLNTHVNHKHPICWDYYIQFLLADLSFSEQWFIKSVWHYCLSCGNRAQSIGDNSAVYSPESVYFHLHKTIGLFLLIHKSKWHPSISGIYAIAAAFESLTL